MDGHGVGDRGFCAHTICPCDSADCELRDADELGVVVFGSTERFRELVADWIDVGDGRRFRGRDEHGVGDGGFGGRFCELDELGFWDDDFDRRFPGV